MSRPIPVSVLAWLFLAWSLLGGTVTALRIARTGGDFIAFYDVTVYWSWVVCTIGMLRRSNLARVAFLWIYAVTALALDFTIRWEEALIPNYVLNGVMFVVVFIFLTLDGVLRWFDAEPWPWAPERLTQAVERAFMASRHSIARAAATAAVGVAWLLVGFFVVRALLDVYAAIVYQPAPAHIVAADVRDADVSTVTLRPGEGGNTGRTNQRSTRIVTYDPKITFRYAVKGKTYERTGFTTFGTTLGAITSPASVRDKYVVGSMQTCWYNPANPSQAVLAFGISPYYAFLPFVLILLVITRTIRASVNPD